MQVDDEVAPTLATMETHYQTLLRELLPLLHKKDDEEEENAIFSEESIAQYEVEQQGKLYLSAAFVLALGLYSLDRLNGNPAGPNAPSSTSGTSNDTDPQLVLKIERITEYIKKLKEISQLHQQQQQQQSSDPAKEEDPMFQSVKRPKRDTKVVGRLLQHVQERNEVLGKGTTSKRTKETDDTNNKETAGTDDEKPKKKKRKREA